MYTRPGRGPRRAASRATARLISPASSPASLGDSRSGSGGVGTSSAASCSTRRAIRCGSGCSWTRYRAGTPRCSEQLGDLLVGEDHQMLDQPVGLRLGHRAGAVTAPSASKLNSGSNDSTSSDPHRSSGGERGGRAARQGERLRHLRRRLGATGEELIELVVVEACVGADAAPVEARRPRLAARAQLDLRRHGQALDSRRKAACCIAERRGQHRLHGARARRCCCARRSASESRPRAGPHMGSDVRDVDPEPHAVPLRLGRDGVVEVARAWPGRR